MYKSKNFDKESARSIGDKTEHSVANIVDLQNEIRSESIQQPDRLMVNNPNINNEVLSSS